MPSLNELKQAMVKAAKDAEVIFNDDKLTSAEKNEHLEKVDAECKSLSDQIATEVELEKKRARFAGLEAEYHADRDEKSLGDPEEQRHAPERFMSPGQAITESAGYKSMLATLKLSPSSIVSSGPVEVKATLTEGVGATGSSGTSASAGKLIPPDLQVGVLPLLFQPVTIASLMPSGSTNSNTVRYPVETTATNAASAVSEGADKPEGTLAFDTVDEPVRKIAIMFKVSDEALEDIPFMRSWIDGRLQLFVTIEEELQLLSGNGTAPDLTGLLNRNNLTTVQALGGDTRPDCLFKEITKIRIASFLEPDGIVLHPSDWQDIRLGKDAASQYYGGGPFTGQYGNGGMVAPNGNLTGAGESIWGKRVVSTQNISAGTALVGAFATAAQVFRRGGMTLEATNSHDTDFKKNLISIRCEERLALAVYRPSAFGTCSGL